MSVVCFYSSKKIQRKINFSYIIFFSRISFL
nr:MAG TPA: hypothetical protein [Caudoviricetes sp.]